MSETDAAVTWRLDLARQIVTHLRAFDGIAAIAVGGSVARGYADAYSDLELLLFWQGLPDDRTRHVIVEALGAELLYPYDNASGADNLLIDGFQVDLWHNTVAGEEQVFDKVLLQHSTDAGDSNFLDTVRVCIPLHGEALIARWKRRAQAYPDALAARTIAEQLPALAIGHLPIHAARNNPTLVYEQVSQLQQALFLILLALNRAYFPTFKWLYETLETLLVKPADLERRLRQCFTLPPEQAVAHITELIRETLALVHQQLPQVDMSEALQSLALRRRPHTRPPHLPAGASSQAVAVRAQAPPKLIKTPQPETRPPAPAPTEPPGIASAPPQRRTLRQAKPSPPHEQANPAEMVFRLKLPDDTAGKKRRKDKAPVAMPEPTEEQLRERAAWKQAQETGRPVEFEGRWLVPEGVGAWQAIDMMPEGVREATREAMQERVVGAIQGLIKSKRESLEKQEGEMGEKFRSFPYAAQMALAETLVRQQLGWPEAPMKELIVQYGGQVERKDGEGRLEDEAGQ